MPYIKLRTWYKMVTVNSVKFSSVTYKIFPSNTGEPSRSTFDAQSLLFGLRFRHYCGNTIISFVLVSVGTIWAAKRCTKFSIERKLQDSLQLAPRTHTICFDSIRTIRPSEYCIDSVDCWSLFTRSTIHRICKIAWFRSSWPFIFSLEKFVTKYRLMLICRSVSPFYYKNGKITLHWLSRL